MLKLYLFCVLQTKNYGRMPINNEIHNVSTLNLRIRKAFRKIQKPTYFIDVLNCPELKSNIALSTTSQMHSKPPFHLFILPISIVEKREMAGAQHAHVSQFLRPRKISATKNLMNFISHVQEIILVFLRPLFTDPYSSLTGVRTEDRQGSRNIPKTKLAHKKNCIS